MQSKITHNFEGNAEGTTINFTIYFFHSPAEKGFIRDWFAEFQKKFATTVLNDFQPDQITITYNPQVVKAIDPTFSDIYQKLISDIEIQVQLLQDILLMKKDWIASQDKILELTAQLEEFKTFLKILAGKCNKLKSYRDKFDFLKET